MATRAHPNELAPIDIRRAVLAALLRANGGPLSIAEIVERTRTDSHLDLTRLCGTPPQRRVSDILRHQVRAGRAQVVDRERLRRRYLGLP